MEFTANDLSRAIVLTQKCLATRQTGFLQSALRNLRAARRLLLAQCPVNAGVYLLTANQYIKAEISSRNI